MADLQVPALAGLGVAIIGGFALHIRQFFKLLRATGQEPQG